MNNFRVINSEINSAKEALLTLKNEYGDYKHIKNQFYKYGIKIEYLEIRNKFNLSKQFNRNNFKLFVAFYINKVRLIDNF